MANDTNYQNEISKLNEEVSYLRQQLQSQQLESSTYKESLGKAQRRSVSQPLPRDINPILKQIRNKNLSMREKKNILFPELYPSSPEDIFYQWVAPSRVAIHRDKQWYWTMGLLLMILITIAVIFRELIWIAVVLAFFFALYVNSSIPAQDTIYKLTRQGIELGEGDGLELYSWGQLLEYSFYFKNNTEVLYIDTLLSVPQRIQMLFSQEDRKNISMILEANLPYKPAPLKQGWLLKIADGIYIPLQDFKALQEKIDQYYDQKYAELITELKKEGKIPHDVSVEEIRKAESIQTLKLVDSINKQKEDEAKRALGL